MTLLTSSCDCLQKVSGTILDNDTKQPLDSVSITKVGNNLNEFTNSKGNFTITAISGGLCGCPPMKINIKKAEYEVATAKIKSARSKTLYLKKNKK
ncbi:MAG: carboxypeptidase-like regulatory domain-containing protein [Bacteroidia bacterium]